MPSFTNKDWLILANEIGNDFQELTDILKLYRDEVLYKNMDTSLDEWVKTQFAQGKKYSDNVLNIISKQRDKIMESLNDKADQIVKIVRETIDDEFVDDEVLKYRMFESLKDEVNRDATLLYNSTVNTQKVIAAQVKQTLDYKNHINNKGITLKDLYEQIDKYKNRNPIDVVYNNGRRYNMRSYIEMSVRTTIQNTATDYLVESAGEMGIIFHLCNSYQDCAPDHADFQGRVYVVKGWEGKIQDEDLRDKVRQFIQTNNIKYLEDIVDGTEQWYNPKSKKYQGVYLTTRPNCRHFFRAVTIEEALNYKQTLKDQKMENGKYDKKKYEALEQQRKLERDIRKYKMDIEEKKEALNNTTDPTTVSQIKSQITASNKKLHAKQKDMRDLISKNGNLVRLPKRESIDPQGVFKR